MRPEHGGILKRILLAGWALLFLGAFLILEFPNTAWNRAVSEFVWVFSIVLFLATLGYVPVVAVRLIRRGKPSEGSLISPTAVHDDTPRKPWLRRLAIAGLAVGVFVVALLAFIEHEIRSSPVFQTAVARAQNTSTVVALVGEPVNAGWLVSGQLTESANGGGQATLRIPMRGPKGSGAVRLRAERRAGYWQFVLLQFVPDGNDPPVDLLAGKPN